VNFYSTGDTGEKSGILIQKEPSAASRMKIPTEKPDNVPLAMSSLPGECSAVRWPRKFGYHCEESQEVAPEKAPKETQPRSEGVLDSVGGGMRGGAVVG